MSDSENVKRSLARIEQKSDIKVCRDSSSCFFVIVRVLRGSFSYCKEKNDPPNHTKKNHTETHEKGGQKFQISLASFLMSRCYRNWGLVLLSLMAVGALAAVNRTADARVGPRQPIADAPSDVFSPSNARTADGNLIPADQFFPAARCAGCHQDTH